MNNKSRAIATNGILIALMLVMTATMFVTGGMAFLPLTVLVVGMVIEGKWTALILGFTFGLFSLISAYIFPSPTAPFFQNPLVSLLPRVLSVILAYSIYKLADLLLRKLSTKTKKPINKYVIKSISIALGAIFVVFFNTLLVLSMIWILYNGKTLGSVFVNKEFVMGLITINFLVEILVTPILSVPITFAVDKFLKRNRKQVVTNEDIKVLDEQDMPQNKLDYEQEIASKSQQNETEDSLNYENNNKVETLSEVEALPNCEVVSEEESLSETEDLDSSKCGEDKDFEQKDKFEQLDQK